MYSTFKHLSYKLNRLFLKNASKISQKISDIGHCVGISAMRQISVEAVIFLRSSHLVTFP